MLTLHSRRQIWKPHDCKNQWRCACQDAKLWRCGGVPRSSTHPSLPHPEEIPIGGQSFELSLTEDSLVVVQRPAYTFQGRDRAAVQQCYSEIRLPTLHRTPFIFRRCSSSSVGFCKATSYGAGKTLRRSTAACASDYQV